MSEPTNSIDADKAGYTRQVIISSEENSTEFGAFLRPHTNIDGKFKAFDTDRQKVVEVDGEKAMVREVD